MLWRHFYLAWRLTMPSNSWTETFFWSWLVPFFESWCQRLRSTIFVFTPLPKCLYVGVRLVFFVIAFGNYVKCSWWNCLCSGLCIHCDVGVWSSSRSSPIRRKSRDALWRCINYQYIYCIWMGESYTSTVAFRTQVCTGEIYTFVFGVFFSVSM